MRHTSFAVGKAISPILKRWIVIASTISILFSSSAPSYARGAGKFLTSLVARGAAREAIAGNHSQSNPLSTKLYTTDTLTIAQLATCIKKAEKLDEYSEQLENRRNALLASKSEIEQAIAAIEFQKQKVDHYNQASVRAFNAMVDRYNAIVTDGKTAQGNFNTLVDRHNSAIESYNLECAKKYYADDLPTAQQLALQPQPRRAD